ncbi:UNVERIFIED_CONTAM: hypothetical protein RMT77_000096 [Armadillidium vulgare]
MTSYYTPRKGLVNRYWKRPKPRVYECNIRDAERFYQQSYKEYLDAKEWANRKASDDRSYISDDSRWTLRRTNSLTDSADYNTDRNSYLNSNIGAKQYGEDSYTSSMRSTSMAGTRKQSPPSDVSSIEERLQKLQRLRSELGLPSSEISSQTSTKVKFSLPSPTASTTNLSRNRTFTSPDPRERRGKTVDVSSSSSYSSTRGGGRAYATDLSSDSYGDSGAERSSRFKSKYSYEDSSDLGSTQNGTERSSRFASKYKLEDSTDATPKQNGTERSSKYASKYSYEDSSDIRPKQNGIGSSYSTKDESDKYSFKSSLKSDKKYNDDDSSYTYKSPKSDIGGSKSYASSRKTPAVEDNDIEDYDADAFLSNIKKKFPTSEEILERIKKMDSDM